MNLLKFFLIFALASFFSVHFNSALTLDMRSSFAAQETALVEVKGLLEPISMTNVVVKRENVVVPVESGIVKFGDKTFIWFVAPNVKGNYSLWLRGVATLVDGVLGQVDVEKKFLVNENLTAYTITPGAIVTQQDFSITATVHGDEEQNINVDFPERSNVTLKPGKNVIRFSLSKFTNPSLQKISVGVYSVPIFLGKPPAGGPETSIGLLFMPSVFEQEVFLGEKPIVLRAQLKNIYNKTLSQIVFRYDSAIFDIAPKTNISLEPNNTIGINITLKNISEGDFFESISARTGNFSANLVFRLSVIKNKSAPPRPVVNDSINKTAPDNYSCDEIDGGRICGKSEKCEGNSVQSSNGPCCIGTCSVGNSGGGKTWAGVLLLLIVIGLAVYIFMRYKKSKVEKDPIVEKVSREEKRHP